MGRIKGANSDCKLIDGKIKVLEAPDPAIDKAYLRIFFCPYNQPGPLESEDNFCIGENNSCPNTSGVSGHALILLHQDTGITLRTDDNNHVTIDQDGSIHLCPTKNGKVEVIGNFVIKQKNSDAIVVNVLENIISLETTGGAKVILKEDGNIDLITKNNTGTVKIHGNLDVTGTMPGGK